jgi:hypothetical protein
MTQDWIDPRTGANMQGAWDELETQNIKSEVKKLRSENIVITREQHEITVRALCAEIEQLKHNQISADHVTLAQAAAIQVQRADALSRKCDQLTEALLKAMSLVDELLRENTRLCAASDQPPDVKLFAAKHSFDGAMHKLLSENAAGS